MKRFESHSFDFRQYERELNEFGEFLKNHVELREAEEILPFFKERRQLASQIGCIFPTIHSTEKIAFEYDLFGDFKCDFVVGDPFSNSYCFVEFEDAQKDSVFRVRRSKYCPEFARRFEKGYSQIIDWFYKIDGMEGTADFAARFGAMHIHYEGMLIIGRSQFLDAPDQARLNWRTNNVIVNSKKIHCYTFDEIHLILSRKLELLRKFLE